MAIYLDGIQEIDDYITEFNTVASGTLTVSTGTQTPILVDPIPTPKKAYRNYVLLVQNKTGQTINTVNVVGTTVLNNSPVPNVTAGLSFTLKSITPSPTIANTNRGAVDITSEEPNPFLIGSCKFQFSLAAAPTAAGTIDWALIGY